MDEPNREQTAEAETGSERLRRASDDVLMRIGRNLLVYQRIETNLKRLAAGQRPLTFGPEVAPDDLRAQVTGNRSAVERRTLGHTLHSVFVDGDASEHVDIGDGGSLRICITSRTILDAVGERLKRWQDTIVSERNRLAHGFLDSFDIETIEGCEGTCRQLDEAHETALDFLHRARSFLEGQKEARTLAFDILKSDDFLTWLSSVLMLDALVRALHTAAQRLARPDGWCVFDRAAQAIRAEEADLVAEVLARGDFRTLRQAAEATNAFAWHEEATRNGTRWLFRRQSTE